MNYQDWKDKYHDELISNWKDSDTEKSFDNYCRQVWREREDDKS